MTRKVIGHTVDENKNFKFVYEDEISKENSILDKAKKEAQSLNKKYKLINIEIQSLAGIKTLDDLVFQAEYARDAVEGGDDYDDELEYLREEGKTEGQIKRMQQTAINALTKFIDKYKEAK